MNPSTANFAAQYASLNGCPMTPPTLVTVISRPWLVRRWGSAARVTPTTPKKFTSITALTWSMVSFSIVPRWPEPALLTTASRRP